MTRPCRRMTLHFSQIFLTLGRTFIGPLLFLLSWVRSSSTAAKQRYSLVAVGDATSGEVVGSEFHLNLVAGQDADVVHPHFPGDVRQHFVAIFELDPEHRVRE